MSKQRRWERFFNLFNMTHKVAEQELKTYVILIHGVAI